MCINNDYEPQNTNVQMYFKCDNDYGPTTPTPMCKYKVQGVYCINVYNEHTKKRQTK